MTSHRHFGLTQVWPEPTDLKATAEKKVDIIVLHGLDAQSPKTWIAWLRDDDPSSGDVNWLSDEHMLPASMPEARILTYDWNANYDTTASSDRFLGHADTLLDRIYTNRQKSNRLEVPILFVASCFSGLLLAQALVRAAESYHPRHKEYRQVLHLTVGVAFLGTPFQGSWDIGYSVADLRVAVAIEAGHEPNRELMEYLRQGTPKSPGPLNSLVQRFSEMIHHEHFKFGKVCFYETRPTNFSAYRKKLPKDYAEKLDETGHGIVVAQSSACLAGVERVALDVRHNMLHKFNSPENDGFVRLASRLNRFFQTAEEVLRQNGYTTKTMGDSLETEPEKELERRSECLKALYFDGIDYEPGQIRKPVGTSCEWLLQSQAYSNWHRDGHGIFWILGSPGSGKSTLIKHAIQSCQTHDGQNSTCAVSFFFHNQGKPLQLTVEGLLRALLHQLLQRFPEQMRSFSQTLNTQKAMNLGDSRWESPYLMRLLEAALERVTECFNIRIFVDALDECRNNGNQQDETQEVRNLVQGFREVEDRLRSASRKLSICFACRHYPQLTRLNHDGHIVAEVCNGEDIGDYVRQELAREINREQDQPLKDALEAEILGSANGSFLWATLITSKALGMYNKGKPNILEEVQRIPKEVTEIYESIITTLQRETPAISLKFFQWVCFAMRPLDVHELRFAINIIPEPCYEVFADLPSPFWGETEGEMEKLVCSLSGGLAEVHGPQKAVLFIHQSVKDYMLRTGFCILDPAQSDIREVRKLGHELLFTSCLWWSTERKFSIALDGLMDSFSGILQTGFLLHPTSFKLREYKDDLWIKFLDWRDVRHIIDALSPLERRTMRQNLDPEEMIPRDQKYPQNHRKASSSEDFGGWLEVDEALACFLAIAVMFHHTFSFRGIMYCLQHWVDHAQHCLESDSSDALNLGLDYFFSRAQPSLLVFYGYFEPILQMAASLSNPFILRGLLSRDIDRRFALNSPHPIFPCTPLMVASAYGKIDHVRTLLHQDDIDINAMSSQVVSVTVPHSGGGLAIAEFVEYNKHDSHGLTALMGAVQNNQDEVVELLLHHGARTDVVDANGLTALDHAVNAGNTKLCHLLEKWAKKEKHHLVSLRRITNVCKNWSKERFHQHTG